MNRLSPELEARGLQPGEPVVIAVDASGIEVSNRGEWVRRRWKAERRGYLKVHLAVDVRTKQILAVDVTSEKVSDGERLQPLVEEASGHAQVARVLADGAYDSNRSGATLS